MCSHWLSERTIGIPHFLSFLKCAHKFTTSKRHKRRNCSLHLKCCVPLSCLQGVLNCPPYTSSSPLPLKFSLSASLPSSLQAPYFTDFASLPSQGLFSLCPSVCQFSEADQTSLRDLSFYSLSNQQPPLLSNWLQRAARHHHLRQQSHPVAQTQSVVHAG